MKKLIIIIIFLVIGLVFYLLQNNVDPKSENLVPRKEEIIGQIEVEKLPRPTVEKSYKTKEIYLTDLNRIIKDQYAELDVCENEFNVHFGDLLEMNNEEQLEYIKDPNNLENLLDIFSKINFTTPTSAKVIKEFADPISEKVALVEVYHKPGSQDRVDICSPRGKLDILELLYKSKIKNKKIMRALLNFFENENTTLNYPWTLYDNMRELKKLLKFQGIPESKFPELEKIDKDFKAFNKKISNLMKENSPREDPTLDYKEAKLQYEYALKLQAEIKPLLKQIKGSFK